MSALFAQVAFHVRNHPRVRTLARELGVPRMQALGALTALWTLVGEQAEDGKLSASRWTLGDLEDDLLWDGEHGQLVTALVQTEWLDVEQDGWSVPGWHSYTGAGLNQRAKTRARVRKHRQNRKPVKDLGDVTPTRNVTVTPKCNASQNVTVTEEQNRTEQKRTEQGNAAAKAPAELFDPPPLSAEDIEAGALDSRSKTKNLEDGSWLHAVWEANLAAIRREHGPNAGPRGFKDQDRTAIRSMLRAGALPSDVVKAAKGIVWRAEGGDPRPPLHCTLAYAARAWEECSALYEDGGPPAPRGRQVEDGGDWAADAARGLAEVGHD